MTRIILKTLIITILAIGCTPKPPTNCVKGLMQQAQYSDCRATDKKSLKTRLKETMERMERFLED
jgi:hypothetical protein